MFYFNRKSLSLLEANVGRQSILTIPLIKKNVRKFLSCDFSLGRDQLNVTAQMIGEHNNTTLAIILGKGANKVDCYGVLIKFGE